MTDAEDRAAKLEARLQDGFTRIGQAMAEHKDVTNWEEAWTKILREYEQINDEIAAHHAAPRPAVQVALMDLPRQEVGV